MTTPLKTSEEVTDHSSPVFLQLQYCDSCTAARGMYRVWVDRWFVDENGNGKSLDLVLCSHHFNAHEAHILEKGYEVDELT